MDAEGTLDWRQATDGRLMGEHHQQLIKLTEQITRLSQSAPVVMQTHSPFPLIPEKYAGDPALCKDFLLQCSLLFTSYVGMPEAQKITHFIELLIDKALTWVTVVWERGSKPISSYEQFTGLF